MLVYTGQQRPLEKMLGVYRTKAYPEMSNAERENENVLKKWPSLRFYRRSSLYSDHAVVYEQHLAHVSRSHTVGYDKNDRNSLEITRRLGFAS